MMNEEFAREKKELVSSITKWSFEEEFAQILREGESALVQEAMSRIDSSCQEHMACRTINPESESSVHDVYSRILDGLVFTTKSKTQPPLPLKVSHNVKIMRFLCKKQRDDIVETFEGDDLKQLGNQLEETPDFVLWAKNKEGEKFPLCTLELKKKFNDKDKEQIAGYLKTISSCWN